MKNFLGVIGGMGPLATSDFLSKLVDHTAAQTDQENIPVIVYGDCTTPDRTKNIVDDGPSPYPQLLQAVKFLNDAGVGSICITCNSAHHWYSELTKHSAAPIFSIIKASADQVHKKNPNIKTVGVLSTYGTFQVGIYNQALKELGFNVVLPTLEEFNTLISPGISFIKANRLAEAEIVFEKASDSLVSRGAEIVILGCTEIPIGMQQQYAQHPDKFVDSSEALAISVVEFYSKSGSINDPR
jgi:aspartate racemase